MILIRDIGTYQLIGQTVDDAIGEAFDKVAKMLHLLYPGGPKIEELALQGDAKRFPFKAGQVKGRALDFSFSGLKTAVLYTLRQWNSQSLSEQDKKDIAASFQQAALSDIVHKTRIAIHLRPLSKIG